MKSHSGYFCLATTETVMYDEISLSRTQIYDPMCAGDKISYNCAVLFPRHFEQTMRLLVATTKCHKTSPQNESHQRRNVSQLLKPRLVTLQFHPRPKWVVGAECDVAGIPRLFYRFTLFLIDPPVSVDIHLPCGTQREYLHALRDLYEFQPCLVWRYIRVKRAANTTLDKCGLLAGKHAKRVWLLSAPLSQT